MVACITNWPGQFFFRAHVHSTKITSPQEFLFVFLFFSLRFNVLYHKLHVHLLKILKKKYEYGLLYSVYICMCVMVYVF